MVAWYYLVKIGIPFSCLVQADFTSMMNSFQVEEHLQRRTDSASAAQVLALQHADRRADPVARAPHPRAASRRRRRRRREHSKARPATAEEVLEVRPHEAQSRRRILLRGRRRRTRLARLSGRSRDDPGSLGEMRNEYRVDVEVTYRVGLT